MQRAAESRVATGGAAPRRLPLPLAAEHEIIGQTDVTSERDRIQSERKELRREHGELYERVSEEFRRWFGEDEAGTIDAYESIGRDIWSAVSGTRWVKQSEG